MKVLVYRIELVYLDEINVYPNGFAIIEESDIRTLKRIGSGYYAEEIGDIIVTKENINEFIEPDGTFWYWDEKEKTPLRAKSGNTSNPIKEAINNV